MDFTQANPVITLSTPLAFQEDFSYSFFFTLTPLTSSTAMILMYNNTTPLNINGVGPLQASIASVTGGTTTDASAATIHVGNFTTLASSSLSYYLAATTLSENTVVVAYADASQDYAIVCQVVRLLNQTGVASNQQPIGKIHHVSMHI